MSLNEDIVARAAPGTIHRMTVEADAAEERLIALRGGTSLAPRPGMSS